MADTLRSFVWLTIMLIGYGSAASSQTRTTGPDDFAVLLFTKTTGFRHDSIPAGIAAIQAMGREHGFTVNATEDATAFNNDNLKRYRVVVFLSTTGDILDGNQQTAFETFIRNGGGFVGIHSATDTEYDWPWYGQLVGAYFASHPDIQRARLTVVDSSHPSTQPLPTEWTRTDEWYDFRADPSANVRVLITIDESTYSGGRMGPRHPISWYHEFDGGRAWYTAMGHTSESYNESLFLSHVLGGILWAAKEEPARESIKRGYVIVTPDANSCCPSATLTLAAVSGGAVQSQAATAPFPLTSDASLFVDLAPSPLTILGLPS